jgi:tetratricopeptide (TPR) repeat protein
MTNNFDFIINCYLNNQKLLQNIGFSDSKQFIESIDYFNKALQIDPNSSEAYYEKGKALSNITNQNSIASSCFSKAIRINPDNYLFHLGICSYLFLL